MEPYYFGANQGDCHETSYAHKAVFRAFQILQIKGERSLW